MILVTGATGKVGREVVGQLQEKGMPVRAVSRHPDGAATLPAGLEVVQADLADPESLESQLAGVETVFLLWPFTSPEAATDLAPRVVDVIAGQASRIVYLSAQAATDQPESFWARVERLVEASGTEWTFLRPVGFAANTLMWADQIRAGDVVRWPFGEAARSLIHEKDIASVAVRALTEDGHGGGRYVLSGPAALTQADQVSTIGEAIGRPLRWEEISPEQARPGLVAAFGDEAFADSALASWSKFVTRAELVTSTVEDVTGSPALSFRTWAGDHAGDFR